MKYRLKQRLCRWFGHSWGPTHRGIFSINAFTYPPLETGYGPFPRNEEMDYRNCQRCGVLDILGGLSNLTNPQSSGSPKS